MSKTTTLTGQPCVVTGGLLKLLKLGRTFGLPESRYRQPWSDTHCAPIPTYSTVFMFIFCCCNARYRQTWSTRHCLALICDLTMLFPDIIDHGGQIMTSHTVFNSKDFDWKLLTTFVVTFCLCCVLSSMKFRGQQRLATANMTAWSVLLFCRVLFCLILIALSMFNVQCTFILKYYS